MTPEVEAMFRENVADTNRLLRKSGRCQFHNQDIYVPWTRIRRYPNGNEIPLCDTHWDFCASHEDDEGTEILEFTVSRLGAADV